MEFDVFSGVGSLVEKSLLKEYDVDGDPRFLMLETIREYAMNRLEESGELEKIKRRHACYFQAFAEQLGPQLRGPNSLRCLSQLGMELNNLRAMFSWNGAHNNHDEMLSAAAAMMWFWVMTGLPSEGGGWMESALTGAMPGSAKAKTLYRAGMLASIQGNYNRGQALCEEGLQISDALGDKQSMAWSLLYLALTTDFQGKLGPAREIYEKSLALSREIDDKLCMAEALRLLGMTVSRLGEYREALELIEESKSLLAEIEDRRGLGSIAVTHRVVLNEQGDYGAAEMQRENISSPIPQSFRKLWDAGTAATRAVLDENTFKIAWEQGRAMALDQAIEYALQVGSDKDG